MEVSEKARYVRLDGYIELHFTDGSRVLEHRHVMATSLGRTLLSTEIVHHKNGIRNDNSISNLELTDRSSHAKHHADEHPAQTIKKKCPVCSCFFNLKVSKYRFRLKSESNPIFYCSRKCSLPRRRMLSDEQLSEVRRLLSAGVSLAKIAEKMNVAKSTIGHIKTGKTYAQNEE